MRLSKPTYDQLKSGNWRARYRVPRELLPEMNTQGLNVRPSRTFPNKYHAEEWAKAELKALDLGTWVHPDIRETEKVQRQITVRDWLNTVHDNLLREGKRETTVEKHRQVVANRITEPVTPGDTDPRITALADMQLTAVTARDVHEWFYAVSETYDTPPTNQKAYKRLRAAYAEAIRQGMLTTNPADVRAGNKRVKPKEKHLATDDELRRIMSATLPQHKAATSLTLYHGLRIAEALAVEYDDVKITYPDGPDGQPEARVRVKQNSDRLGAKGEKGRMVIYPPKTSAGHRTVKIMAAHVPLFIEHREKYAPQSPATFEDKGTGKSRTARMFIANANDGLLLHGTFRKALADARKRAGVTETITPHSGRNWLITRLAEQGAHLKAIGRILGQEDLGTIMNVYMAVKPGHTEELMDAVNGTIE